ncbi:chemotaxis protein CheD [Parasaccharibacter sp. TMW2.1882]|uniref:Probable chemoreceptor glutamine deamidase CheD n=2 Tax=Acetobacteraceae TaxID=433 RepID=A0A7U7G4Q0_9PROT|nr:MULTISPECIES: chemotaxis protein CheD [Acetobacteraceae]MCK8637195.1 chemotaxis protein CheD [Parasaccharibacter sp. TMW2.1885]MCL1497186.1 chemotaxis protein CheD [Parasaccharibacter sp. TMW2.1882]MCL1512115.1 chemotaxis protein CheD [Parasaccharibacter sp. TMW 2.1884]MCL1513819.1 chemotaxis protein CheD [Parasaccharibacter sp. TMW 2.1891]MCL1515455.1 chemotaxis protein CheD [Parasaccharibacter sp. TMW2.1890]MCL1562407.1 chemotaxis protein CheD [Parasaccharibacter sp. TMW 2.1886]MCQ00408
MTDLLKITTVIQGEIAISDDPGVVFGTLLGSCISVCMYDLQAGVGGMNHFLLPGEDCMGSMDAAAYLYGVNAMKGLETGLMKAGGVRERFQCKAFGGAAVLSIASDIGQENVGFLLDYFRREEIRCVSYSFGGNQVRRIRFWPTTGKVLQNLC